MSTMKRLKKSFGVAKQNVMEKTHNRENTQETKVLKDFERVSTLFSITNLPPFIVNPLSHVSLVD
jgi:hypothetical protein